jgi:hypothetical protein
MSLWFDERAVGKINAFTVGALHVQYGLDGMYSICNVALTKQHLWFCMFLKVSAIQYLRYVVYVMCCM